MKTSTAFSSWVPPAVALLHIAAGVMDLFLLHNKDARDAGDDVWHEAEGFCFLLALLHQGVSYRGASYLSVLVHTLGVVKKYRDGDMAFLLDNYEEVMEHAIWILLAVLVLLLGRRRLDGADGLPHGSILCFYFEETNGKKSLSCLQPSPNEYPEETIHTTDTSKQVWVRAGHRMESPERLVVRKEIESDDKRSFSPTNTPTSSPPISPARLSPTTTTTTHASPIDENLSMARLVDSVVNSTTTGATSSSSSSSVPMLKRFTDTTQQEQEHPQGGAGASVQVAKVKNLHAALLDNGGNATASIVPTIREARGLINEMLAKSSMARNKEKVS